jgi:hypothetical protein
VERMRACFEWRVCATISDETDGEVWLRCAFGHAAGLS